MSGVNETTMTAERTEADTFPQPDQDEGENESGVVPVSETGTTPVADRADARAIRETDQSSHVNTTGQPQEVTKPRTAERESRINPDDHRFVRAITLGVLFAGLVAFLISFVALMEVAAWLGLPSWIHWGVPAFIDTAILVYAGSVLIHKARGEKSWPSWLMLAIFTLVSMIANTAHALSYADTLDENWHGLVGAGLAAIVPVAVFAATEQLARVAVEDPVTRRKKLKAEAEWASQHAEREREQLQLEAARERARQEAELEQEEHLNKVEELRAQREARAEQAARKAAQATSESAEEEQVPKLRVVETQPPKKSTGSQQSSRSAKSAPDLDEVVDFIKARTAEGLETSGGDLSREFGFSDKTGRRRLAQLRENRPEIFTDAEEDH